MMHYFREITVLSKFYEIILRINILPSGRESEGFTERQ